MDKHSIRFVLLFVLLFFIIKINATVDLSNVDLKNFKYFKYPTVHIPVNSGKGYYRIRVQPPNTLFDFDKAKAIAKYLRKLFFGSPLDSQEIPIVFDPNFGKKWRPEYQRRFGYRGEKLIDLLGRGYRVGKLSYHGAINKKY